MILASLLGLIQTASAQIGGPPDVGLPKDELPDLILKIVNAALILVGVLALAAIAYGGFLYITAAGDEKQIGKAKIILTYSIIGIIVIGVAAALVNFVIDAVLGG